MLPNGLRAGCGQRQCHQYPSGVSWASVYIEAGDVSLKKEKADSEGSIDKETAAHIAQNPNGVDLYYGLLLTAHPYSQVASAKKGLIPMALLVSGGAFVDYRKYGN